MNKEISILDLAPISENMPTLNRRNEEVNYPMSDPDEHEFDAKQTGKTLTERIKARNVKEAIGLTSMPIGSVPGAIEKQVINYGDGDQEASDSSGFGKSSPMDLPEDQPPVNIERKDSGTSEYNVLGNPTNNKDKSKEVFFSWLGFGDESRVVTSKENKMNKELNKLALALNNSGYAAQSNMIRKMAEPTLPTYGPQEAPQNAASAVGHKENAPDTIRPAMRDFFAKTKAAVESDYDNLFSGLDDAAFNSIGNALLSQYDRGALQDWRSFADTFGEQCQRISHTNNDADVKELIDFLFEGGQNPGSDSAAEYNNALTAANALQHAYQSSMSSYSALRPKMIRKCSSDPILIAMNGFFAAAKYAVKEDQDNLFAGDDAASFDMISDGMTSAYGRGQLSSFPLFEDAFKQRTRALDYGQNDEDVTELNSFLFGDGSNPGSQSAPMYAAAKDTLEALADAYSRGYAPAAVSRQANNRRTVHRANFDLVEGASIDPESQYILNPEMVSYTVYDNPRYHVFDAEDRRVLEYATNALPAARGSGPITVLLSSYLWDDDMGAPQTGPIADDAIAGKLWIKMDGKWLSKEGSAATWAQESFADDQVTLKAISSRPKKKDSLDKTAGPSGQGQPPAPSQGGSGGGSGGGSSSASVNGNTNPFPSHVPRPAPGAAEGDIGKIQTELQSGSYYTGTVDDDWGTNTQRAWYNFWVAAHNDFKNNPGYVPASHDSYFTSMRNDAGYAATWRDSGAGAAAALDRLNRTITQMGESQQASGVRLDPYASVENTQREASVTDSVIRNFFGNKASVWPATGIMSGYPSLNTAKNDAVNAVTNATNLSEYLQGLRADYITEPFGMHIFGRRGSNNGGIVRFIDSWMQTPAIKDDIKKMILDLDVVSSGTTIPSLAGGSIDRVDNATQAATATARQTAAKIQAVVERLVTRDTIVALVADITDETVSEKDGLYSLSDLSRTAIDMSGMVLSADGGGLVKVLSGIDQMTLVGYETQARDLFSRWLTPGVFGYFYPGNTAVSDTFDPMLTRAAESTTIAAILQAVGETSLAGRLV
jgi:hypothetical protein